MGKNIIQQARGKGGPRYRAPSFKYKAEVKYVPDANNAVIEDFVKCAGHSAPLAKIKLTTGEENFMIASTGMKVGNTIEMGENASLKFGNIIPLKNIPIGTEVFNIESKPGDGGKFVRAGGSYAKVIAQKEKEVVIQLPSKKQKSFHPNCLASIGIIAGAGRKDKPFLKAGTRFFYMKARNKLYPRVKGQSMNAVDHPFGTSRSSKKGFPSIAPKNAPPGRNVGKLHPRRTGKKR
ncbi:MAG: 50S ribosomal protein L2 [archaeon]